MSDLQTGDLLPTHSDENGSQSRAEEPDIKVSVIIPVYNDSERLRLCLAGLAQQTYPKNQFEVIVVDNNSKENIIAVVNKFPPFQVAIETKTGSYAARNKGICLSKGEIIAFTDSDCVPAPDWIENGVKALTQSPEIGQVAGKISLFYQKPDRPTSIELYDELMMGFPQHQFIEEQHYGATANVFTFRSVIEQVGAFNDDLKSIGDFEWGNRIFSAGYRQVYAKDARVSHPARHKFSQVYKKTVRITGGIYDLEQEQEKSNFWALSRSVLHDLMPPFRFVFEIFDKPELNIKHKFDIVLLRFALKQIRAWENLRLRLGGASNRG